ncbi:MAG: hypothetical protein V3V08_17435, partial [Nannocystaceae bacterium]
CLCSSGHGFRTFSARPPIHKISDTPPFRVRCGRRMPHLGKISCQSKNATLVVAGQVDLLLFPRLLLFVSKFLKLT